MAAPDLEELAATLATGFEALLVEVGRRRQIECALREQLDYARREVTRHADSFYETTEERQAVLAQLSINPAVTAAEVHTVPLKDPVLDEPVIHKAHTLLKHARARPRPESRSCSRVRPARDPGDLEEDFTTPGVQGGLSCPFAQVTTQQYPHTPDSTIDPLATEYHPDRTSVSSHATNSAQVPKCPIRFLDQHSPEEMAQYFENHKHEIPRSHEICVKRYQANETSIKELDRKYGNLVSMIQGLGVKHKQYLHVKGDDEAGGTPDTEARPLGEEAETTQRKSSQAVVAAWANDVPRSEPQKPAVTLPRLELPAEGEEGVEAATGSEADKEERVGHFEKPLREIRVGESPSRPWGIPVPVETNPAVERTISSVQGEGEMGYALNNIMDDMTPFKDSKCPFGHGADTTEAQPEVENDANGSEKEKPADSTSTFDRADKPHGAGRPPIIFNGPIMLGYPPEQAIKFLKAWRRP